MAVAPDPSSCIRWSIRTIARSLQQNPNSRLSQRLSHGVNARIDHVEPDVDGWVW